MTLYNTRNRSTFYSQPVRTVLHSAESLYHLVPKIWQLIPSDMKNFHHSQSSKKPLNNVSHMLVHVGFVEPTSTGLVSFNLWIQSQLFLHGFLVLSIYDMCVCMCMYVCMFVCCSYIYFTALLIRMVDVDYLLCVAISYFIFSCGIIYKFINLK